MAATGQALSAYVAIFGVLATAGCNAGMSDSRPAASAPAGWTVHHDPMGFSLNLPPSWSVAPDGSSGRISVSGPQDEQMIIWPAWAPQGLDVSIAQVMAASFAKRIAADINVPDGWSEPQPDGATAVRAFGRSSARVAVITLAWISTARGAAAFFYAIAGPESVYRQDQDNFARILASFRVTGNPSANHAGSGASAADAGIHYVSWTDPHEDAFSLEVPEGWEINGGLIRRNALDPRVAVRVKSPDHAITLASGDAELPGFVLLSPQYAAMFPEGSWYSPGAGIQWQVRRFTPAVPFGEEYLRMRLPSVCQNFVVKEHRERPDVAQVMDREAQGFRQYGQVMNSAGEIAFTCSQDGQPREGYLLVTTQFIQSGVLHLWYAKDLLAYLAPPDRTAEAQAVLSHMYQSFRVNLQWVARQQQTTMQVSQIATETQQHISSVINSTYWNKVSVQDENMRKVENAILGTTDVVDPATGEQRRIENSSNYYWINNRGTIVGTNTDSVPGVDFRRLTQLP
jgi:hypothetical protein